MIMIVKMTMKLIIMINYGDDNNDCEDDYDDKNDDCDDGNDNGK